MSAPYAWMSRGGRGVGPAPFFVAGIVNVTPDSFSDGGRCIRPEDAIERCRRLLCDGATILDIGGESTRPGAVPVGQEEELARIGPVVSACLTMRDTAPHVHIAVDTWRAATAAAVLIMGVDIINDISGAGFDPGMADVVAHYKPGYVLMHTPAPPHTMQEGTDYGPGGVVDAVMDFFERTMGKLVAAGLPEENIILDPGIGFGKTLDQNLELLRNTDRLHSLGRPLYVGISRKRMFGEMLGLPVAGRDSATQVLTAMLAERGVLVHRVHDVAGAMAALELVRRLH